MAATRLEIVALRLGNPRSKLTKLSLALCAAKCTNRPFCVAYKFLRRGSQIRGEKA